MLLLVMLLMMLSKKKNVSQMFFGHKTHWTQIFDCLLVAAVVVDDAVAAGDAADGQLELVDPFEPNSGQPAVWPP